MKSDIKPRLLALAEADYTAPRLTQLARQQIAVIWDDLSIREIDELDRWLLEQQMATQGRAQIAWTYIRATFTSIRQAGGP